MAKKPTPKKKAPAKKKPAAKKKTGRPSKYSAALVLTVEMMARLGMTDVQMADKIQVAESTFNKWKKDYPEFKKALKVGKIESDQQVISALRQRAIGYSHPEDKILIAGGKPVIVPTIKHYPPDTMAAMYWLNNRFRDTGEWAQRQEISIDIENDPVRLIADALAQRKSAEPPPK